MRENADRGGIGVFKCCSSTGVSSGKQSVVVALPSEQWVKCSREMAQTRYVKKCGIAVQAQAQLPRPMLPTFPNLNYMKYI